MITPIQQAALDYDARGWRTVRVHAREGKWEGKEPFGKSWQNSKPSASDFNPGENIGVMTGPKSAGLVDLDLDNAGAREFSALPDLFGDCPAFGREGLPYPGHRLVYCSDLGDNAKRWQFNPEGDFVDVRAGKTMTVFPPSEHHSKIVWAGGRIPASIPTWTWQELSKRAWLVAFLATCLKFYPGPGAHDDYVMAVAGALANRGVEPEIAARLIHGLCTVAGDTHEINTRTGKALPTWNKVQAGEPARALTYLCENHFTTDFAKKLPTYLQPKEAHVKTDINAIWVDDPDVSAYTDAVAKRIMELDEHLLFQRSGELVRIHEVESLEQKHGDSVRIHPGTVQLVPVEEPWLDYRVTKMGMEFFGYSARGKRKHKPPSDLKKRIIKVHDGLPFHPLVGISTTPILSCDVPGYDPSTKLFLAFPAGMFPAGETDPSKDIARDALARILYPFRMFQFLNDGSRSVVASAMLSGVIRASMETCPLHAINAPLAGAGKTKITQMVSLVTTGHAATNLVEYTHDEDEFTKRLFSLFLRGASHITIDNVNSKLQGSFFNMALTSSVVTHRILGKSESPPVSTRALIMATGNNLSANDEIQRRMVTATIDPNCEYPTLRSFPFEPVAEIAKIREKVVMDCLCILRAYIGADRPCDPVPLGMFDDWTVVRGALIWLGMKDPCATQRTGTVTDPERDARLAVLLALYDWRKSGVFTSAQINALLEGQPVRQAFDGALRNGWSTRGGGSLLAKYAGHWTGDFCLRRGPVVHQAVTWFVEHRTGEESEAALAPMQHEFGEAYARAEGHQ